MIDKNPDRSSLPFLPWARPCRGTEDVPVQEGRSLRLSQRTAYREV